MKITSQSSSELVLREGSASGIIAGCGVLIAGGLVAYYLREANPYVIWGGLALMVIGVIVILTSSSITVTANRSSGQILYQKKRLIGGSSTNYNIADIFRIETRKQWRIQNTQPAGNQGGPPVQQPQLVAQSVIVFKDGREVALDHQKTSSSTQVGSMVMMGGQGAETAIAAQVAQFLNVPFQEVMPPNMSSGMNININNY